VNPASLHVEIVYAAPQRTLRRTLPLPMGTTVGEALQVAARDPAFAGLDLANAPIGIFGTLARADHVLQQGDRIEILRPLAADPKSARRERVKQARRKPR
jgi:putative ubiquitin-RnfH superfamily antitoxin RatB of RatAB toxin-antitoxin module